MLKSINKIIFYSRVCDTHYYCRNLYISNAYVTSETLLHSILKWESIKNLKIN